MQPINPQEREKLRQRGVTDAEIDEYQTLVAERFMGSSQEKSPEIERKQARLRELAAKIMRP